MIKASYSRLYGPLLFEEKGKRFIITHLMLNLFNHQAHYMGQNRIINYFMESNTFFG